MKKTKEQIYRELDIPKDKKPFEFSYTMPLLDWFETIKVKINPEDYYYFRLERRFGPSWWLYGSNPVDEPNYHWEDTELGQLGFDDSDDEVKRFIEWAKTGSGSRIIEIKTISGSFDIFKEIERVLSN